jgi:hypothetical protein
LEEAGEPKEKGERRQKNASSPPTVLDMLLGGSGELKRISELDPISYLILIRARKYIFITAI